MNNHKKDAKDAKAKLTDKHFQKSGLRFNEHARFTITDTLTNTNLDKKILRQLWKMWKTVMKQKTIFLCMWFFWSISHYIKGARKGGSFNLCANSFVHIDTHWLTSHVKKIMELQLFGDSKSFHLLTLDVLQVDFRFLYQLINLVWLSFDFFSFSWSLTISFFVALYFCVHSYQNEMSVI